MDWKPPTEDEFNGWSRPAEVLEALHDIPKGYSQRRWLLSRLKAEMLIAVARAGPDQTGELVSFVPISPRLWKIWDESGPNYFWDVGDATFDVYGSSGYGAATIYQFFDVRFDPQTFTGRPAKTTPQYAVKHSAPKPETPLGAAEIARFAQLYLNVWESKAVEGRALEAIRACYPDKSIGRDPFYKIFRELRGPGKRGNPAFRGK